MSEELRLKYPSATPAECGRFWHSFGSDSAGYLRDYLEFKENAELKLAPSDGIKEGESPSLWVQCMKAALKDHPIDETDTSLHESSSPIFHPILTVPTTNDGEIARCVDGKPILYVCPARLDFDLYPPALYSTCMLYFCYRTFQGEPFTVMVDVRAGRGWANMSITRMYSWLRSCSGEMSNLFPGGLHKCIVFTIPFVAKALWYVVKPLLSQRITDSLVLVPGSGTSYVTPLPDEMCEHVASEVLRGIEDKRQSWFVPEEQEIDGS